MKRGLSEDEECIQNEIAEIHTRLYEAKARLKALQGPSTDAEPKSPHSHGFSPTTSDTHFLLLLSDTALPIGSFAFSSGLESYLVHSPQAASFSHFLSLSLSSYASTTLPFALAAHRDPSSLAELDDLLDATIICTVGRRASVAQGRALLGIWERSFRPTLSSAEAAFIKDFGQLLKRDASSSWDGVPPVAAHLAPLFGAVCAVVGLSLRQTAYIFMLGHVRAVVSAAVRASVFGPYQAQKVLASEATQDMMNAVIEREWATEVTDAGQTVPVMDLWIGRHELLYSRIFNS